MVKVVKILKRSHINSKVTISNSIHFLRLTFSALVVGQTFTHFVVSRSAAFVSVVLDGVAEGRCAVWWVLFVPSAGARGGASVRLVGHAAAVR